MSGFMSRWLWRAACAAIVAALFIYTYLYIYLPPNVVPEQLSVNPWAIGQIAAVLATVFVLVSLGDMIFERSKPRLRTMRRSALVSFASGVLAALLALSMFLAIFAFLVAPIGVGAGLFTLWKEAARHERHDPFNLIGLVLNLLAPCVFVLIIMALRQPSH